MPILPNPQNRLRRKSVLAVTLLTACVLGLWRCQWSQDPKVEEQASFDKLYDSLAQYDSVVIVFKDANGNFLDTVFNGKVDAHDKLRNLPVKGWDGKKARILISGFNGNNLVYQIEKKFDGASDQTDANILLVSPVTALACDVRELTMAEGDSLGLPTVTVSPSSLSDKTVLWSSSDSGVVKIGPGFLKALGRGLASLTARLRSDTSKSVRIAVTVLANTRMPDSLRLLPDTLRLAADGANGRFTIRVSPSSADAGVAWRIGDPAVALVTAQGVAQGLKAGQTWVWAVSKSKSLLSDSALILVSDPVPVQKVRFLKNPLTLYLGGASDTLAVSISPALANPEILFSVSDSAIVSLKDGKIAGIAEGHARIIARSKPYPDVADTLLATVVAGRPVEKVVIADKPAGPAYTGGPTVRLKASVLPADAPQPIQWRVSDGALAGIDDSGRVTGRAPGVVVVYAVSAADSSKKDSAVVQIKRDMPQLSVGRDTVVSVGATVAFTPTAKKESGSIIAFKWDLDGDMAWDDSAAALKPVSRKYDQEKVYLARFYVRDDEGNDTLVSLKVKVVKGLVVLIQSPANNSSTNKSPVKVVWTVDGKAQDTLPLEILKEGANVLTRTAKDSAGTPFSASVTVVYDTLPPNKPMVRGTALTASPQPTWTWGTGGSGGAGVFRFNLDAETFLKPETKDTVFTPAAALADGVHTLYVQERDAAGNWSPSGQFTTTLDHTPPNPPAMNLSLPRSPLNTLRPTWSWASGGGGVGAYQVKLGDSDFSAGATPVSGTFYTPSANLAEGAQTLYVRERDSAQNWSAPSARTIFLAPRDTLGGLGFTDGHASEPKIVVTNTGTVFAAYYDYKNSGTVTVKRYQFSRKLWSDAGTGLDFTRLYDFALGPDDVPYIVVGNTNTNTFVMRLTNSAWQTLGGPSEDGTSIAGSNYSLCFTSSGMPYLAFISEQQIILKRFTGISWETVNGNKIGENPRNLSLAMSSSNQPILAFQGQVDDRNSDVYVVSANPSDYWAKWDTIGAGPVFQTNVGATLKLKSYSNNIFLGILANAGEANPLRILLSSGGAFTAIQTAPASYFDISIGPLGTLLLAYTKLEFPSDQIMIMELRNNSWNNVGNALQSSGAITSPSIGVTENGVPFVGFYDEAAGGKPSVIRTSFEP